MNKLPMSTVELNKNLDVLELLNDTVYLVTKPIRVKELCIRATEFRCELRILSNASFICGCVLNIENVSGVLDIFAGEDTHMVLQLGLRVKGNNNLVINNTLNANNSDSCIRLRVAGEDKSHTILKTSGILPKGTKDNVFLEDVKYFMDDESYIECIPELLVSSHDVIANHNNSIGSVNPDELFYLLTKGIQFHRAMEILRESFLASMIIREEE